MPTECSPELFGFSPVEGREVVAAFDAGAITSDAGALLLGATDRTIGMMDRFALCFHDVRCPELIEHEVVTLVGQRVFGIALGYEDLNDHDELRHDPLMAVLAGKLEARRQDCAPVAGKSTLNRLELSCLEPTRYHKISHNPVAIKGLFVDLFLEAHDRAPNQIILDLDATDDPVHGEQEGRFFHGYYDCYCYLPLYVFCGRDLLAAKLRRANIDAAAGSVEEVARIVAQIRRRWPCVRILLRADSGFAREELMAWCEANGVHFLFGLAKTDRLIVEIKAELEQAAVQSRRTGKPARRFKDFRWTTRTSWSRRRRVVAKAEWTKDEANPRFVVTSLTRADCKARYLYEKVYCAPRRHGEPDQGVSARSLCRSHLDRHHAGKSAAPVVCLNGLCAAVCLAPHRPASHAVRQSNLRHHPSQAAQDRRPRASECPPYQGCDGVSVSCGRYLGLRCQASRRCRQRAGLARLTRAAATPNPRGINPRPTETTSSRPLRPRKLLRPLTSPDASASCACMRANKRAHKSIRLCKDTVR